MNYIYENDHQLANDVCDKNDKGNKKNHNARSYMQNKYYKILLSIGHRFVHYDSGNYNPKNDYDKVLNAYEWLSIKLIQLCCKYRTIDKSKLDTFIKASLYSKFTKLEWYKYDFKSKYKIEEYVPRCLQNHSTSYKMIFKLLFRRNSIETIISKMKMDKERIEEKINEIELLLYKNGKDYLLNEYINNYSSLDTLINKEDRNINIELENDAAELKNIISESIKSISTSHRRLLIMYWGSGLNALQILSIKKSSDFSTYLEDIDIYSDKDLYNYIGIICKEILEYINLKHSNYFNDYNLTTKKIKKIIKQYFFYIYDLQKEKNDVQFYNLLNKTLMN